MADPKKPSLTVLGGPMAGTRFVFEDASEDVTVGSDEGSSFRLELPGVSPHHARIVVEGGALFIHDIDTGSERGLHVNDNRVGEGGTALRNGDIVWLGTPGDAEVVMLQCILPRLTSSPPAPAAPAPAPPAHEDENATLALEPDTLFGAETVIQPAPPPVEPEVTLAQEFVVAHEPEPAASPEPVTFSIDDEPTQMLPPSAPRIENEFKETVMDAPFVIPEESSTVVLDAMDVTGEMPEPTVVLPAEPEVTLAMPPPEPTRSVPPAPVKPLVSKPVPTRASPPPVTKAAAPAAAASRPSRPAPSPRPRPQPAERSAPADRSTPPPPRASGGSSTGLYAGLGIAALVIVGGGYFGWRYYSKKPGPPAPVAQATRTPTTLPSASTPLVTQATPHPIATAEARPVEPPTPAPVVATPTPKATVAPAATPSPSPSPSPSPKKGTPTPPPVTAPSAEAQRAQQVAGLLGQAEAALGGRQYDQAIGHFDEVLRLDPQNAKALADKATAVSLRDAARKKFVPGRTAVKTEKASGGLAGFDSGDVAVQKAPDFLGRIEFEMSPASGIKPGDPYTLRFFLVNDGKKAIRIQGITLNTTVNGTGSGTPVSAATKEVAPQQRAPLGEVTGSWKDGTTSWSAEVLVTANKGDSLKNQISWR
jgi:hypothetical protein